MITKFALIGLAGSGKSTTTTECQKLLHSMGYACEIYSSDDIVNARIKPNDPVVIQFERERNLKISPEVFTSLKPAAAFMRIHGEEPLYRDFEEMLVMDIIANAKETDWFDLGGKVPLRSSVAEGLRQHHVVPVFLYALHETILNRLEVGDGWRKRGNYENAGVEGWKSVVKQHRDDRLLKYIECASIAISVDQNDEGVLTPKTSAEVAREIFYRIVELKIACTSRRNVFTDKNKQLFAYADSSPRRNAFSFKGKRD